MRVGDRLSSTTDRSVSSSGFPLRFFPPLRISLEAVGDISNPLQRRRSLSNARKRFRNGQAGDSLNCPKCRAGRDFASLSRTGQAFDPGQAAVGRSIECGGQDRNRSVLGTRKAAEWNALCTLQSSAGKGRAHARSLVRPMGTASMTSWSGRARAFLWTGATPPSRGG